MKIGRITFVLYLLTLCLSFTGCEIIGRNEQDKLAFPSVLAIDVMDNDMVKITTSSKEEDASMGGGGGAETVKVKRSEGRTVFEADRVLTSFSQRDIHWGQNEYIVLGENAARDDALKYLDFYIRNYETRLNVSVAVVKNEEGEDLIVELSKGKIAVSDQLSKIFSNDGALSLSRDITLLEFAQNLNSKYTSAILPVVEIVQDPGSEVGETSGKESGGEQNSSESNSEQVEENGGEQKILSLNGYAVFKNTKLIGFIENEKARGLNWITDNIRSTVIVVKDDKGEKVSLDVIKSKADVKTKINDDVPSVSIRLRMRSNIGEMYGRSDIFNTKGLSLLEAQQSEIIKKEIESVIAFAQENNTDIFGFGETIHRNNPIKWEKIKGSWNEIFPEMEIEVEVESRIARTYAISIPIRDWEVEEEE